jgi:hypothetical protein
VTLQEALEWEGFEVAPCQSCEEALRLMRGVRVDAIVVRVGPKPELTRAFVAWRSRLTRATAGSSHQGSRSASRGA